METGVHRAGLAAGAWVDRWFKRATAMRADVVGFAISVGCPVLAWNLHRDVLTTQNQTLSVVVSVLSLALVGLIRTGRSATATEHDLPQRWSL